MTGLAPTTWRPALEALLQQGALASLLDAALAGVAGAAVAVAVGRGGSLATAAVNEDGERSSQPSAQPIGCLAKLFTATLANAAVREGCFDFDGHVSELLGADLAALRGVTVRHLIEHTHGFDDSLFRRTSGPRDGFIDLEALLAEVARLPRFARPGALYHYGHIGAWLTAAVLERARHRSYDAQVRDGILAPLGAYEHPLAGPMDPASAASILLDAPTLVRFLERRPRNQGSEPPSITPLPGWNPLEHGIQLGWKVAGRDWLGHQSVWPQASAYVRVHRASGWALAVLSRTHAAAVVARALFGAALPELFELRPPPFPRDATSERRPPLERFEQAALVVHLESSRVRVRARDEHGRLGHEFVAALHPTAGGVLFVDPPHALLPYAQVVTFEGARWLWTGRALLRRSP